MSNSNNNYQEISHQLTKKDKVFLFLQKFLPQHFLSRLGGKLTNSKSIWLKNFLIKKAMKSFNISLSEASRKNIDDYQTFNDFFTRALQDGARPINKDKNIIVSPADGNVSQFGKIYNDKIIQAKNHNYSLLELFAGNLNAVNEYKNGDFITVYLSPSDYHRVHMPFDGRLLKMTYVPGKLFSVNKLTAENIPAIFARNERVICEFETSIGKMSVIFVGAFFVASIVTAWHGIVAPSFYNDIKVWDYSEQNLNFEKGQELGYFQFGSTVICTFPENKISFDESIKNDAFIKMGQTMNKI